MLIIPPDNSPSDNSLAPALSCIGNKTRVKSVGSSLKRDKITFTHKICTLFMRYVFLILITIILL